MKDTAKTKKQLIAELEELRQQRAVEKAAERIREEVLAMRKSEDIYKVVAVIFQEIVNLGIDTPSASIGFIDEEKNIQKNFRAIFNPRKFGYSWSSPHTLEINDEVIVHYFEVSLSDYENRTGLSPLDLK